MGGGALHRSLKCPRRPLWHPGEGFTPPGDAHLQGAEIVGEAQLPHLKGWGWLRAKQAGVDIMGAEGAAEISLIIMGTGPLWALQIQKNWECFLHTGSQSLNEKFRYLLAVSGTSVKCKIANQILSVQACRITTGISIYISCLQFVSGLTTAAWFNIFPTAPPHFALYWYLIYCCIPWGWNNWG